MIRGLPKQSAQSPSDDNRVSLSEAVQWAEDHLFDRNSVVLECLIWQEALGRARGNDFAIDELKAFTGKRGYIRDESRPGEVTRRDVLLREWEIVQTAREGAGEFGPLVEQMSATNPELDDEQRRVLRYILGTTNLISLFRGAAGTGKSFVLKELVEQIELSGRKTVVLAPQRQQVMDMEKAGFPAPTTLSSFLVRPELSEGAVLIVDEAGLVGGSQMLDLIRLVRDRKARLILSGDTRRHGPVEASDALLAIERHSGIKPVELHHVRRQDPALARDANERRQIKTYRQAVEAAASGDLATSFQRLEEMGAVVPCGLGNQTDRLANEYLSLTGENMSVVVVSQTWTEIHRVNSQVREALKKSGQLGPGDTQVEILDKLDLTNAQKRDQRFYPPDATIIFNRKVRETEAGTKGKLGGILKTGVLIEVGGRFIKVSNLMLDRLTVCSPREIPIAQGDRLHVKANRNLTSGARVTNGEIVTVQAVNPDGRVELIDGRVIDATFREFLPGYAISSYGSQGKTVDYVLFSDSTIKAATNTEQWYVTISRGRRGVRIFTPDKQQLQENVLRSGHRKLALELAGGIPNRMISPVWRTLHTRLLRFGRRAADTICRLKSIRRRKQLIKKQHENQTTRMLGNRPAGPRPSH